MSALEDDEPATLTEAAAFMDRHATAIILIAQVVWWVLMLIVVGGGNAVHRRDQSGD